MALKKRARAIRRPLLSSGWLNPKKKPDTLVVAFGYNFAILVITLVVAFGYNFAILVITLVVALVITFKQKLVITLPFWL